MTLKDEERRRYSRIRVNCEIHFAPGLELDKSKRVYSHAIVKDLSGGGLSFESTKAFPVGQMLHLTLNFWAKKTPLHVRGEVRRCTPLSDGKSGVFIIGVEFLSEGHLQQILLDYI